MQTALMISNEERIIGKARKGLSMVTEGENRTMKGWLLYGAALNEGRELFAGDLEFGQWVSLLQLDTADRVDRAAAMWAAANPQDFQATKEASPRVRTVRGLHAKFKNPEPQPVKEIATQAELSMMRKLHAVATHDTTDPGTKENAQRKLNNYCERFGVDQQSLVEQDDKPNAVGMTRREMKNAIADVIFASQKRDKARAFIRAALETAYNDAELLDTLNQVERLL